MASSNPRCPSCGQRTKVPEGHLELQAESDDGGVVRALWHCTRLEARKDPLTGRWT